jgi:acyl carrier protein
MGLFGWLGKLLGGDGAGQTASEKEHAELIALLGPVGSCPVSAAVRKIAIRQVQGSGGTEVVEDLVTEETSVGDLGCDELDVVEITLAIEDYYGIELPGIDDDVLMETTLGELVEMTQEVLAAE